MKRLWWVANLIQIEEVFDLWCRLSGKMTVVKSTIAAYASTTGERYCYLSPQLARD
jgi:hypothetical protein